MSHPTPTPSVKTGLRTWRPLPPYAGCDRCGLPVHSARVIRAGEPVICCHCQTPAERRELHARKEAA